MSLSRNTDVLKKFEKEITKEGKVEESRVNHVLKDLAKTEKAHTKADKDLHHAGGTLAKTEKQETKALKALNKATQEHDISVTKRHSAEMDVKATEQRAAKLQKELAAAKQKADAAVSEKQQHDKEREQRLAEAHNPAPQPIEQGVATNEQRVG